MLSDNIDTENFMDRHCNIKQHDILVEESSNGKRLYGFPSIKPYGLSFSPSVTTVMQVVDKSMALVPWAYNLGLRAACGILEDVDYTGERNYDSVKVEAKDRKLSNKDALEAGRNRGNIIHDYFEQSLIGKPPLAKDKTYMGYYDAVDRFLDDYQPKLIASEFKVVSSVFLFGGRPDYLVTIGAHPKGRRHEDLTGQMVLLDAKTNESGSVYPVQHLPQIEAYKHAIFEMSMGAIKVDNAMVVGIGNGSKKLSPVVSYADIETFLCILKMYNAIEAMKKANPNGRS